MSFQMPQFQRKGSLTDHYTDLMRKIDLTADDAGEAKLAELMRRFFLDGELFAVESEKFKTAAFFYALALEKGRTDFLMEDYDIRRFKDYLTATIVAEEQANPGKHKALKAVEGAGIGCPVIVEADISKGEKT